ncbi:uncharacterized protein LOC131657720 [Vicia villosa]|uniref:uncharacterized protein LOC131657720 n=1 Tax=Vicia villosa TaxID=3911 RepID=UPI00273B6745|nr:uncharacterized protein LOC131657720 [Vicia villosa]
MARVSTFGWIIGLIHNNIQVAIPSLLGIVSAYSVPAVEVQDLFAWKNSISGILTLKEAYNLVTQPSSNSTWKSFPWDKDSPPSHSMTVWRLMHNKIPTDDNLQTRGFLFPSLCTLCSTCSETSNHFFFDCKYANNIWNWFSSIINVNFSILSIEDCKKTISLNRSPQAKAVIHASIVGIIHHVWNAINQARFKDKIISWKSCASKIKAYAKVVGNHNKRASNGSMPSFSLLKQFDINIQPSNFAITLDVIWSPPLSGWIKCNVDGVAKGSPSLAACGRIFRDHNVNHIVSFSSYLAEESAETAEFIALITALELAKEKNFDKI